MKKLNRIMTAAKTISAKTAAAPATDAVTDFILRCILITFIVTVFGLQSGYAADSVVVKWMPAEKMVPKLFSDARAHQSSFKKNVNSGEFVGSFGGIFPVAQVFFKQRQYQVSFAATVYNTYYIPSDFLHVITADFFVDVWVDTPVDEWTYLRLGAGHSSQHMVDDALQIYRYSSSINYSHDYIETGIIREFPASQSIVYAFAAYNYAFRIAAIRRPGFSFQTGAVYCLPSIASGVTPYISADLKFRGELHYRVSHHYLAGMKFQGESDLQFRIALSYEAGAEERGQFYDGTVHMLGIGAYFDL